MKKKDIYKLKKCLRDFRTKDHLLVSWPFVIWMSFKNCLSCPLMMDLGSFSLLLNSSYGFEHHHIVFFFMLKTFDPLDFSSCPLDLFGHLWWLRIFFYAPQCCFNTFNHWVLFFMSLALAPSVGCDPSQGYFLKKSIRLKRGLQMIYFSLVKKLSKMAFLHFKLMHLGSVSLAFMRVYNVISHYSFK
jgi:hypothetical protein